MTWQAGQVHLLYLASHQHLLRGPTTPQAEATIAALLEEAREEARRAKAAAAAAEAAERDAAAAASAAEASLAAAEREQAAAARTVVGLEEEGAGAPRQHARPPRPAAARHVAPAVEPVVLPEENFELPEVVRTLKEKVGRWGRLQAGGGGVLAGQRLRVGQAGC